MAELTAEHAAARDDAARQAANAASLARLTDGTGTPAVQIYSGTAQMPGAMLVEIPLQDTPAMLSLDGLDIIISTPAEAVVTQGGEAGFAQIIDASARVWMTSTVSGQGEGGEVEIDSTTLYYGGTARITSATIQG